ncbi:MAG: hypothetical protein WCH65_00130 [bacterium]
MEILQILHQSIPEKKKIFALFHNKHQQDISKPLLQMIKKIKKGTKDIRIINSFCIEFYDLLYYYIMFDKIKVMKKMLRLLEHLATPIACIGEYERVDSLKKISKIKI